MWILALIFAISTAFLSRWQLYRLEWKNNIIDQMHEAYNLSILDHPHDLQEFRRVSFQGKWINQPLFLKYKIQKSELGCELVMPFQEDGGEVFLVNLGWQTSCTKVESILPEKAQGYLRKTLSSPEGTPPNLPGIEWYYVNSSEMKSRLNIKFEEKFHIYSRSYLPNFPNNHLIYAITWGLMSIIFIAFSINIWRYRKEKISP